MYLVNTSYGWNLGDDLIREGVINLLRLSGKPMVFINRADVRCNGASRPLWKVLGNMPSPDELCRNAKAFIVAGTPAWLGGAQEFYQASLEHNVPIYIVGVGMKQWAGDRHLLAKCKPLIKGATVRDRFAQRFLRGRGIRANWFPDPAFHANYPASEKQLSLVVNYRAEGGNGVFGDGLDKYWRKIAKRFGHDIDLVTVHEPGEYERAAAIFDAPIFYSSDYRDYKSIYSKTARYLGGRIHGATPVVACGGTAWLIYGTQKVEALRQVAKLGETLHILTYDQILPANLDIMPSERMLQELEAKRVEHRNYWATRI